MKKFYWPAILLLFFLMTMMGCGGQTSEEEARTGGSPSDEAIEINISAASSLTDALTEIQKEYAKESNAILQFNFGASGTLQKQIEEGAPCDLFLSASKANMDALEQGGLIVSDSREDLLGNTLTLVTSAEKADLIQGYKALASDAAASIAMGTPESVPAGKYAQQALQNLGLWDQIQDKLIFGKDVKQVLEYVDSGNVDCGLVYKTDALAMKTGVVVMDLPEASHDPIVYPAALIKDSAQPEAAAKFYDFLKGGKAQEIFKKYGFAVQ